MTSADQDLKSLIEDLKKDPDKIYKDLSEEQLRDVARVVNPYSYIRPRDDSVDDHITIAAISHTNLEEEYLRRFLMTSMVGFIYRMYDEYEIDRSDRSFVNDNKTTEKLADKEVYTPMTLEKISGNVRTVQKYVKEFEIITEQLEKMKNKKISLELEEKELDEGDKKILESLEKSVLSLSFICTYYFTQFGEDAVRRTEELVNKIKEHKDVYESIIELGYNPPLPPNTVEVPEKFCKNQIKEFIDSYFEYNPDKHVRSSLDKTKLTPDEKKQFDKFDKYRPTMELLKTKVGLSDKDKDLEEIFSDRETYNSCMYLLKNKPHLLKKLSEDSESYVTRLSPVTQENRLADHIPPADTFFRWNYYNEVNMEEIRNVVSAVYDEKPNFDYAIQIYETFDGTREEVEEKKKKWISKYNEELPSDVNMVPLGNWVLLANYKKNRDEINFYNRQTEVLRRIMDKHSEDKQLGRDLMQKRVKKAKTKNVKEQGKDAEIMRKYAAQYQNLTQLGAKRALSMEEQREIENVSNNIKGLKEVMDVPDNAIQVNVFEHDTKEGTFKQSAIYTESEQPLTTEEIEKHLQESRKVG